MNLTGRNSYIRKAPDYFSRIIHDYSDTKKGFVDWKGIFGGKAGIILFDLYLTIQ